MNRYGWMLLRAYLPALVALVLAVASMLWTSVLGTTSLLHGLVPYAKWLPPVFLVAALGAGLATTLRLWRWQHDQAPKCTGCGGPLGRLQRSVQGDTRKCLACGSRQPVEPR